MNEYMIKYSNPAVIWEEAIPIGNGRIGATVFGRDNEEIIRLCEETLWSGYKYDWTNKESLKYLPQIRQAILSGNYSLANELAKKYMCWGISEDKN